MKTATVVIFDNFEEIEAVAPIDILRRAGIGVTVAAAGASVSVVGRSGIRLTADKLLSEIEGENFDAAIISGGPGVHALANDPKLIAFVRRHFSERKLVCAICAAPVVLNNAGILNGKSVTAHQSVISILKDADTRADVVRDGNVITSRGAGTAVAFALEIVSALEGAQKAVDIAASICHSPRM